MRTTLIFPGWGFPADIPFPGKLSSEEICES
jgi:hypothetical protein